MSSSFQVPVIEIALEIARLLRKPVRLERIDAGYIQSINTAFQRDLLPSDYPLFDRDYWRGVLQHYVPLIAAEFESAGSITRSVF